MKNNNFLENKAPQIFIALNSNDNTISSLIGNISDLFSSPYKRDVIADNDIVKHLWDILFRGCTPEPQIFPQPATAGIVT
jgi:hypothetical protein